MTSTLQTRRKARLEVNARQKLATEQGLAQAFGTFTQAAGSLERSYTLLQNEVGRLREELSRTNAELDRSLEENARMRAYLAQVLENLPCGVVVAGGKEPRIQVINPEARRLLQLPPGWQATEGADTPEFLEKLLAQKSGEDRTSTTAGDAEQFGRRFVGISQSNLVSRNGENGDRIWILRDITDEKRLAAEKEASRRSLALAEIATLLAHEIRNPLGSMELFTGLLAEAASNTPETRQWVNHLQAGLRSLSATVNNVLQFHAQAGVQLVPTDMERVLSEVTEFLQPLAKLRGQQVKFENTIGKVLVQADANRLKQVFLNLAMNGFRAMPPGGSLRASMGWAPQFPGGLVRIEVHDEGRGIAPELLGRIFDAGFTTTPGSPGLGLTVCQKIVEQHGGEIDVQSKLKEGTRFRIVFPVAGGQA
jgi:two-component system sensor histidine kinase FlrB